MDKSHRAFNAKALLKSMTSSPGVYQMIDKQGVIIYVGKARNLKNRLQSYFVKDSQGTKTQAMVAQVADVHVTITHSDVEALLLENTLIKRYHPKYNVLLRDDKSYPYIRLSIEKTYPRISLYRGVKKKQGKFYGPYPSVLAAKEALSFLQRTFKLRTCRDAYFKNRSRPCLQYQIKRCSAPCVSYITEENYQADIRRAQMFLEGKNQHIINELRASMEQAAQTLDFEYAAYLRDQVTYLQQIQAKQSVITDKKNIDVICVLIRHGIVVAQILYIRAGELVGNKNYFPISPKNLNSNDIIHAFMTQYYLQLPAEERWPNEIVISDDFSERKNVMDVFSQLAKKQITILTKPKTDKKRWLDLARQNAEYALDKCLSDKGKNQERLSNLMIALNLSKQPQRIECFDISHSHGEATVASCVVFDTDGMLKSDYRLFNIKDITAGDDYAAMRQALLRRYQNIEKKQAKIPDIVLIDGGKGQLHQAQFVFEDLNLAKHVTLLAISKGPSRKAGLETLHLAQGNEVLILPPDSSALHLLQQIRDEAHRFAITGHRQQRGKKRNISTLETISGIGTVKRRALINRFGGIQAIKNASIEELAKTEGISPELAKRIFEAFHT